MNLILLCDNYPISSGEFFIDDEMEIIANKFEKIIVITANYEKSKLNRFIPENMQISTYQNEISLKDKLNVITYIFKPVFIKELNFIFKTIKFKFWFASCKVMTMDLIKALKHKSQILDIFKTHNLDYSNTIFYSYWHSYKALSLCIISKNNKNIKSIARAHRWDIYFEQNKIPYLPFKNYIISNLSKTYFISSDGKKYLQKRLNKNSDSKIDISRLGKINFRDPLTNKSNTNIIICSCSTLISLKRVNLIIDILSILPFQNIRWVHFGDGFLRTELEQYAKTKISHINYQFKGNVNNSEILDFYNQNYIDFFINVSETEGIPVSIMEALSSGIPVIATNVGGTGEIVNNHHGFLIDKNFKLDDVARIIKQYLQNSDENIMKYRQNAYQFWNFNYNAEINYTKFIENVLKL